MTCKWKPFSVCVGPCHAYAISCAWAHSRYKVANTHYANGLGTRSTRVRAVV